MKSLIIKLQAMGDVLRTTCILRALKGDLTWVTKKECFPLLPVNTKYLTKVIDINEARVLNNERFDLVLSLDENVESLRLAASLKRKDLIGAYLGTDGKISYTDSSRAWFDMSLISKLGKEKADRLKRENKNSYQEIIYRMLGKKFNRQEYVLSMENLKGSRKKDILIGIEKRASSRWPAKTWNQYDQLSMILKEEGFRVRIFRQRRTVSQYINDINDCDLVVCGDTLAMHIALALKKEIAAIFTCTCPQEIYGYGRLEKIVSPLLNKYFYFTRYVPEAVESISIDKVYSAIKARLRCIAA